MREIPFIALLSLASAASAQAADARFVYDSVKGACEEFNAHARDTGLRDSEGNTHVSTLGYTACRFKALPLEQTPKLERSEDSKSVCLSIDLSKAKFEAEATVTVLKWDHPSVSEECRAELARVDSSIRSHESQHVNDCRAILSEAVKKWATESKTTPKVVKVCSQSGKIMSNEELASRLKSKSQSDLLDQLKKMSQEMDYRSRETHERIGYGTSSIDCSRCQPDQNQ